MRFAGQVVACRRNDEYNFYRIDAIGKRYPVTRGPCPAAAEGAANSFPLNPDLFKSDGPPLIRAHGRGTSVFLISVIREVHFGGRLNPNIHRAFCFSFGRRPAIPGTLAPFLFQWFPAEGFETEIAWEPAPVLAPNKYDTLVSEA